MKHKYFDMICAKAANMDLVIFAKNNEGWLKLSSEIIGLHESWSYFACLPQHEATCVHWLNGGELIMESRAWKAPQGIMWPKDSPFMDAACELRIKPRTEKRWIGVFINDKGRMANTTYSYKSIEELKSKAHAPYGFDNWQFIEIEVEMS